MFKCKKCKDKCGQVDKLAKDNANYNKWMRWNG